MSHLVNVNDFNCSLINGYGLVPKPKGNPYKKDRTDLKDVITAFDIESTNIREIKQAIMYIWQFQMGLDWTIVGRTWSEFIDFLQRLKQELNGSKMMIFVHNLSYEFQFLSGVYAFRPDEVFLSDDRKVLRCSMFDCFEFRCSYMLTNMSLKRFTHQMGVKDSKLSGFDYSKYRFSDTPLTDEELQYCINDVLGLVEALTIKFEKEGNTLYTIPLTSTGYVRKEARAELAKFNHEQLKAMLPDADQYRLLRECFRGGNTHCSRWFSTNILENVKSVDRSSSYPDVMINCKFPMTPFEYAGDATVDQVRRWLYHNKALMFRIKLWDVELKSRYWGLPYLAVAKCRDVYDSIEDNGRIVSARYLETSLTDIDFRIILDEYNFSASEVFDCYVAGYGYLPDTYRELVKKYYRGKTALKGDKENEFYYAKYKELLNSLYGLLVQDPCRPTIEFVDDCFQFKDATVEELIEVYRKRSLFPYQWGVWTSAWARYRLEEVVRIAGEQFVYADTDSVKYLGEIDITEYNRQRVEDSTKNGAYAIDSNGEVHYMGVFEVEGNYEKFCSMGAKKYCYVEDGKLHITIAGVSKRKGAEELEKYGGIEAFKEGFTFVEAGGTESTYNDLGDEIIEYQHEGKTYQITSNLYIQNSTYTLGLTADYIRLLSGVWKIKYSETDIPFLYKKYQ